MFITTINLTVDLVLIDSNVDSLSSELIYALRLSHKHDLQFRSLWIVVNELSKFLVYWVIFHGYVYCYPLLEFNDIVLKSFNLNLRILKLLQ